MPVFKIVVNDPPARKSHQLEIDQEKAAALIGKKIGDNFDGSMIGLAGYTLQIRGGTDKDGAPMHPDLRGQVKKRMLLSHAPAFHPPQKGQRKRKMVRGNAVSPTTVQINAKVVAAGPEPLEKLIPQKEGKKEDKEQAKEPAKETKVEEKKEPAKIEAKVETKEAAKEETKTETKTGGG